MKTTDVPVLKIEKTLGRAKRRKNLREAFLRKLNVGRDEPKIDLLVDEFLEKAEATGMEAKNDRGNHKLLYAFLANALALFLLASEPKPRASKLMNRLHEDYVISKHKETTLLSLILKALGPYPHGDRRTVHRDSIVLEYLISRNLLPSDVPSYLGTRGQGIDNTYRVAQDYFHADKPQRRRRYQLTLQPKAAARFARQRVNQNVIALIAKTAGGVVMKDCLIEPAQVREVIKFINSIAKPEAGPHTRS
jgi:hypothetical protein